MTLSVRIKDFKITEKPWGKEFLVEHNEKYTLKDIRMVAGTRSSLQSHNQKLETIVIMSGEIELETRNDFTGPSTFEVYGPGSAYTIPTGKLHRVRVIKDCQLIEVSTPELNDIVRYQDDFGRT